MSSRDCSIDSTDFEPPSCFREQWRKARKQHTCCECHRPIKPGDKYQYISGIWDGDPLSFKTCGPCARIRILGKWDKEEP